MTGCSSVFLETAANFRLFLSVSILLKKGKCSAVVRTKVYYFFNQVRRIMVKI